MSRTMDMVIRGGQVVDGTGRESYVADVAIKDGKIAEIGKVSASGTEEIDAKGQIVTPGFVDIHTHYDGQVTWDNRLSPSSAQGVTTVVMGNCGVGFAPCRPQQRAEMITLMDGVEDIPNVVLTEGVPWKWETFPEYLDFLGSRQYDIDFGAYIPHAALRVYTMGERGTNCEPANADDIAKMSALVGEAVEAGALGFGTSRILFHQTRDGRPIPTLKADLAELMGLSKAMTKANKGIIQYVGMFSEPDEEFEMVRQLVKGSGRPLTFSTTTDAPRVIDLVTEANGAGLPITAQLLPRAVGILLSHELTLNPFYATDAYMKLSHLSFDQKIAELRKPEVRAAIINADYKPNAGSLGTLVRDFDRMFVLGDPPNYEPLPSESIAARAAARGVSPLELAYDLLLENNGRNMLNCAVTNYGKLSLDPHIDAYQRPGIIVGLGDGGAHCATICDASYSTFMLTHMTRDRRGEKMSLERVVKALAKDPCDVVGFHDRGQLKVGYRADVNVIDFDRLRLGAPRLVQDLPAGGRRLLQSAQGYTATVVNGQVTYRDGKHTGVLPGRLVRGAQAAPAA